VKTVIGVMGGAVVNEQVLDDARTMGKLIAENGWVLLTGGRDAGVMAAASMGASQAGGLVVGILPGATVDNSAPGIDIAIPTGMGDARNAINVLSSRVVVVLRGGAGTLSEVALALKAERPVVTIGFPLGPMFMRQHESGQLTDAATPDEAVEHIERLLNLRSCTWA
jgi:uncharacterized protein (TIGR00725 family)